MFPTFNPNKQTKKPENFQFTFKFNNKIFISISDQKLALNKFLNYFLMKKKKKKLNGKQRKGKELERTRMAV